jgi:hypothetical protein
MDIKIDTSTWMMLFFLLSLGASIWKIWAFLPNKELEDDDKTEEAESALKRLMLKVIVEKKGELTNQELFIMMTEDSEFDSKLFWRFNLNRLNHLLRAYYRENPEVSSIKEIYSSR